MSRRAFKPVFFERVSHAEIATYDAHLVERADGASVSFYVFHAISQLAQSENALRSQLTAQGATWIATGISSSGPGPGAFHAAMGYSRNLIPAPGALALLGVAGLAARRRR